MATPWIMEKTFLDITDTVGLSPQQLKTYDQTGTGSDGNSYMTPKTVTSSSVGGTVAREITSIEIIPPQNSSGVYEDLRSIYPILDDQPYAHYIYISGYGEMLINPMRYKFVGGPSMLVTFGVPMWKVLTDPRYAGKPNMALAATCPKYNRTLALAVSSRYGVSSTANGGTGFRIIVRGYEYTDEMLAVLQTVGGGWNDTIHVWPLHTRFAQNPNWPNGYTIQYQQPSAGLTVAGLPGYPGGTKQGPVKVGPYWHKAYNNQATDPNSAFIFSNSTDVQGGTGHINDGYDDLGFTFKGTKNLLLLDGFGVRGVSLPPGQTGAPGTPGSNLARAGWNIGGDLLPDEVGGNEGVFVSENVDTLGYGDAEVLAGQPGRYLRLPLWPGKLALFDVNAAPFVGANGTAIPQDQVAVSITGTIVEAS